LSVIGHSFDDPKIRKIVISSHYALEVAKIGEEVDKFLIPRPWWRPVKETYPWQKHAKVEFVLERCREDWENYFRYLAAVHYPSKEGCSNSSMLVGRSACEHPGWFSVLSFYKITSGGHPYSIQAIYYPELVDRQHQTNTWISKKDCPAEVTNRWTCSFLPTTNCTLPKYVTKCNKNECNNEQNDGFSLILDRADPSGAKVPQDKLSSAGRDAPPHFPHHLANAQSVPYFYVSAPANHSYIATYSRSRDVLNLIDATTAVYIHQFLVRRSFFYRTRIAEMISTFRASTSPYFNATSSCVAVQLRRGDRAIPAHVDPMEWCYNASHKLPCDGGYCNPDLGCSENGGIPFSAINLSHVVEKVPILVGNHVKNIVVASDDPDWLKIQIAIMKKKAPEWNFYTLPAPKSAQVEAGSEPLPGYNYMRARGGTESGTFLFASIELASQCEGFMGHMGSGSTMMYHQSMCVAHAGLRGVCPPTYDFRQGLWL
jgi:hypothetical protein